MSVGMFIIKDNKQNKSEKEKINNYISVMNKKNVGEFEFRMYVRGDMYNI